jgi:8-oxo-dGTP pyrophosphatase MutT (NUDIX family)
VRHFVTIKAAGILFLTKEGRALFVKRGNGGDHPNEFCFPGGQLEEGETALEAAEREAIEEVGVLPAGKRIFWTRRVAADPQIPPALPIDAPPVGAEPEMTPEVDYTVFMQMVDEEFLPRLGDESTGWAWALATEPPQPLHPGCAIALARIGMDELGVARAMAAGDLEGPQRYMNMWLFNIRITGTGVAYRRLLDEHVYRHPDNYLTEEFLARCNGLPVVWMHPKKSATLTSEEYGKRVVGSIFLPYIRNDEVWGIAKIHDDEAAEDMQAGQLSTSPAVVFRKSDSTSFKNEDGSTLLIEGKPILLDHVAICPLGVWDKGDEPTGVARGDSMAERDDKARDDAHRDDRSRDDKARDDRARDDKARDDKARDDRAAADRTREEKARDDKARDDRARDDRARDDKARDDRARDDARRADARKRKDDESEEEYDERMKEMDREDRARDDRARDDTMRRVMDAVTECADAIKGFGKRLDAYDDAQRRKDAEEEEKRAAEGDREAADAVRRRKDEEEEAKAKEEDEAKADAQRRLDARLSEIENRLPRERSREDLTTFYDHQARADRVWGAFGDRAPAFMNGEELRDYRHRLLKPYQKHSKTWEKTDLTKLDDQTFGIAEAQIYADAQHAASDPGMIEYGRLNMHEDRTEAGHLIRTFHGRPRSWMDPIAGPVKQYVKTGLEGRI